ncbi:MAG: hypothetical protein INR62_02100 [Rhodospirillales bacterium]|nr:hypothetical protein [Acetobacter sp.]
MAFPDDLTTEQLLEWSPFTSERPANEYERIERADRQFRVYFIGTVAIELDKLGKKAASVERDQAARALHARIGEVRAVMLRPKYEFLVENHARFLQELDDEVRDLIG